MGEVHLTHTQSLIYQYILDNKKQVKDYSLRQLAAKLDVAPASVVRTVKKMGYDHYYELCAQLDNELQEVDVDDTTYQARAFFESDLSQNYDAKFAEFKKLLRTNPNFIFFGVGTSGVLADYGARQFVNNGCIAFSIEDPFYPTQLVRSTYQNYLAIVLSVSGETDQALEQVMNFNDQGVKVVSITNAEHNPVSEAADLNFSYSIKPRIIGQKINLTSQIPVVYLLERLSHLVRVK